MAELFSTVGKVIDQGFAALAVLSIVVSFIWNQWKMAPVMTALIASSNALLKQAERIESKIDTHTEQLDAQGLVVAKHDQRAEDMHVTCKSHSDLLSDLNGRVSRIEGKLS